MSNYRRIGYILGALIKISKSLLSIAKSLFFTLVNLLLIIKCKIIHYFKMKKLIEKIENENKAKNESVKDKTLK